MSFALIAAADGCIDSLMTRYRVRFKYVKGSSIFRTASGNLMRMWSSVIQSIRPYIDHHHQPFHHRLPSRQKVLSHGRQSSVGKIVTEKSIYALFPPTKPDHIPTIQIISILMPSLINPQPETFLDFKIHLELLMLKQQ